MQTGFVALLDVLGFSALVLDESAGEGLTRYVQTLQDALVSQTQKRVDYVVFSDSIVLTTEDETDAALQSLLMRCSSVFGLMLQSGIPIRGAIAHGSYERSENIGGARFPTSGVFVAGRSIIDAYNFEMQQDWIGVMLAPSTVKRIPDLAARCDIGLVNAINLADLKAAETRIDWGAFVQRCASIPFHSSMPLEDSTYDGFAVVPTYGIAIPEALSDSLSKSLERLNWLKSVAPNPAAQSKYERTIRWLHPLQYRWSQIASWIARYKGEGRY
jgi:hypothetical protein